MKLNAYLIIIVTMSLSLMSCDQASLKKVMDTVGSAAGLTEGDIAKGLKEALDLGVGDAVSFLSKDNGYYKSTYKILLPDEAQNVIDKLSFIPGFEKVEETLVKKINQGAEDAAKKAGPIFLSAIKGMSIGDATKILMGNRDAATQYLHNKTYTSLYNEFSPVLENSLNKYGALDYWTKAVTKYNSLPLVKDVNPDLADHINSKALVGMFDLIEKKEEGIRSDVSQRSTDLLKKVFAKQDN